MTTYLFLFNFIGIVSIGYALHYKRFILLIFNTLIVLTYSVKPILSCMGYFIVYDGCTGGTSVEDMVVFATILPFFLGQFITITPYRIHLKIASLQPMFNGLMLPVILLVLLIAYNWSGSDTFLEYDKNRIAQAEGAGPFNLLLGSMTTLLLISIRYKGFIDTSLIAVLIFAATATKQMMFLPFLLFFAGKFRTGFSKSSLLWIVLIIPFLFLGAQIFRSQGNFDIDIDTMLFRLAAPFDAYDNAVTIIHEVYDKNIGYLIIPYDFQNFVESFANFVPRSIWPDKPEIQGFWRIQRDFLPELFTSTLGMSVSTSLPVDILFNFGLILGSIVLFLFSRFLVLVDDGQINIGYIYPLILMFSVDFSRGGFRNIGMVFIQIAILGIMLKIVKIFTSKQSKIKTSSTGLPCAHV